MRIKVSRIEGKYIVVKIDAKNLEDLKLKKYYKHYGMTKEEAPPKLGGEDYSKDSEYEYTTFVDDSLNSNSIRMIDGEIIGNFYCKYLTMDWGPEDLPKAYYLGGKKPEETE